MKSYYGTLSGSRGRFFRIRHEKSPEALPSGESRWRHILLALIPRFLGYHASQIKSYYWSLSGSNGRSFRIHHKKSPEAPPAEKSWWCHIRLAIKLRYIGNMHASQIKSYFGTLSGNHGHSFRIHHEKLPEAHPGGEMTMTWYLTCNKSS